MSISKDQYTDNKQPFTLQPFFDLSPDLLCIAGFDGYFRKINPSVSRLLGYTNEELFSKPINEFVHPEDQAITQKYRESLTNGVPLLNFENRYITKGGEVVWLAWTSIPVDEEKLVYAIAKNVTYKKQSEEKRNQLITNLTEINQNLKQLTFSTSHDLRAPVSNLVSIFDLLEFEKIQDEETLEFIELLKAATDNLRETLNKYVDNLTGNNGLIVSVEPLNLTHILYTVQKSISSLIKDSQTVFDVDFSEFDTVSFNESYLESIFLNLITNSIKYSKPDQSPVISIYTRSTEDEKKQLIFSDNGQGFDMDKVGDKIFGLNQKFHNYANSKGVGLYLVYNQIKSLGGHISVESEVNEGAKFIITFRN